MKEKTNFPAPFVAHWASGPVDCCQSHANQLVGLGGIMGSHVSVTQNTNPDAQCTNCINEEKDKA